jgi:hypothetical protein
MMVGAERALCVSSGNCPWRTLFKVERYIRSTFERSEVTFLETNVASS